MTDNFLNTRHVRPSFFHFLRMEIFGTFFMATFFGLGFILPELMSDNIHIPLLIVFGIFFIIACLPIVMAFIRANFIRQGGYCVIMPDKIIAICNGKKKEYEYKDRSIKTRKRKQNSMDIYIGKNLIDFVRFGIKKNFFTAYLAILGLAAPLYNVVNADEVLDYIKRHN
ncbi:MAG: hypothetical protein KTR20_09490 [Cellvibrionaceae bacterium]|nr:hypothetical protein [Cellvibrionaceae bacterium]